jgi:hypothetical protein
MQMMMTMMKMMVMVIMTTADCISYLLLHCRMVLTTLQHDFSKQFLILFVPTSTFNQDIKLGNHFILKLKL